MVSNAKITGKAPDYRIMIESEQIALWDSKEVGLRFQGRTRGAKHTNLIPKVELKRASNGQETFSPPTYLAIQGHQE